jgi:GNAT superfamily N-acetyltransferase
MPVNWRSNLLPGVTIFFVYHHCGENIKYTNDIIERCMTKQHILSDGTTNRISIRRATRSDIDIIIEYRIAFLKEIQGTPSLEQESYVRQTLRQYFTNALQNDTFISWIAENNNTPIGFSGMVLRDQPGTFEMPHGKTGYILNMFTVKEFRKKGVGSLLFQRLIEEAKERKLDRVELHATNEGEPMYRKFGFIEPHQKVLELNLYSD